MIERRESVMMQEDNFTLEQPASSRRRVGSEFLQEANRLVSGFSQNTVSAEGRHTGQRWGEA